MIRNKPGLNKLCKQVRQFTRISHVISVIMLILSANFGPAIAYADKKKTNQYEGSSQIFFNDVDYPNRISGEDYRRLMSQNHIPDVIENARLLLAHYPKDFPDLNEALVIDFIGKTHDHPKIMTLNELKKYGYHLDEDIATIFGRFYTLDKKSMNKVEFKYFFTAAKEMYRIEAAIRNSELNQNAKLLGLDNGRTEDQLKLTRIKNQLKIIDHISDIVATVLDPIRRIELKITESPFTRAVNFMMNYDRDENGRRVAHPIFYILMAQYLVDYHTDVKHVIDKKISNHKDSKKNKCIYNFLP